MARKNGKNAQLRIYRQYSTSTLTTAAGRYKLNGILQDIRANLEQLVGTGEEIRVRSAKLTVQLYTATGGAHTRAHIVGMVSDSAIAGADPGDNNTFDNVDDALDVMTAGDYESRVLGAIQTKVQNSNTIVYVGTVTVDVTDFVRKTAQLLARSAILATNPESKLVMVALSAVANASVSQFSWLEVEYTLVPKQLRMLA